MLILWFLASSCFLFRPTRILNHIFLLFLLTGKRIWTFDYLLERKHGFQLVQIFILVFKLFLLPCLLLLLPELCQQWFEGLVLGFDLLLALAFDICDRTGFL